MPHGHQEFIATAPATTVRMGDLAQALLDEANVIEELRQALLRQRAGVAADDVEQVEASIHGMGRTLLTLEEARRRRGALTALISGSDPTPLEKLAGAKACSENCCCYACQGLPPRSVTCCNARQRNR